MKVSDNRWAQKEREAGKRLQQAARHLAICHYFGIVDA